MKKQETIDQDRISHLPQELKEEILNRLPVVDAVRLSILSTLWVDAWKQKTKLELDEHFISHVFFGKTVKTDEFMKLVSDILFKHSGKIKKFLLYIPDLPAYPDTEAWVSYLTRVAVSDLTIMSRYEGYKLEFNPRLFSLATLENLSLTGFQFIRPHHRFVGFRNLTRLEINDTSLDENAFNILVVMSPHLRMLKLTRCVEFEFLLPPNFDGFKVLADLNIHDIKICSRSLGALVSKSPNLVNLSLTKCFGIGPRRIPISIPNVRFLVLDDHFNLYDIRDASQVLSIHLGVALIHGQGHQYCLQNVGQALTTFSNLQSLSLVGQMCVSFGRRLVPSSFLRLTKLSLVSVSLNAELSLAVLNMIQRCPAISNFTLTVGVGCNHLDHLQHYINPGYTFSCLRVFEMKICCGTNVELSLIKTVLANSPELEKLVVFNRLKDMSAAVAIKRASMVRGQLQSFKKASAKVTIYF